MNNKQTFKKQVIKVLHFLKKGGVNYCLIRNFEFLFNRTSEIPKDIDVFVPSKDRKKVIRLLVKNGFELLFDGPTPGHVVLTKYLGTLSQFLTLDLHVGGLTNNGISYYPERLFSKNYITKKNIHVPSKQVFLSALILHSIIDKRYFKPAYEKRVLKLLEDQKLFKNTQNELDKMYGIHLSKKLLKLLKANKFNEACSLKNKLLIKSVMNNPTDLISYIQILITRVVKLLNPFCAGSTIVFIGPDGSGKSTASKQVLEMLSNATIKNHLVYMGWRESIIPFINSLMKTDNKIFLKKKNTNEAKGNLALLTVRSCAISLLYFIELTLRYLIQIFPFYQAGFVVLTDRYYCDRIILDKNLPSVVKKIFAKIIPQPNLIFYFVAKPQTLAEREKNLHLKNLSLQHKAYESWSRRSKIIRIDTDKLSKKEVLLTIVAYIWKRKLFLWQKK